jgi:hypothetical protein
MTRNVMRSLTRECSTLLIPTDRAHFTVLMLELHEPARGANMLVSPEYLMKLGGPSFQNSNPLQ